jgi:DNA-binding transcriptional LysR family regulator
MMVGPEQHVMTLRSAARADLDPYLLRAFLTVVEVGTVSGAATVLNRTQAAVSTQIRKLEDLVGVTLFQRSTKGLNLTAEGQILIPYAREMITLNDEIGHRLNGEVIEGRVRFGVVEDFAATRLIDILRSFRDQNPKVDIDIIVEPNGRLAKMFEEDQLDLVVCDSACVERKPLLVWTEHLLWSVRSDLILESGVPLPIIMFDESCPWTVHAIAALSHLDISWRTVCVASTLVAMATAIRVGIGIGPMIAATIPEGCRALDRSADLPAPIRIDIGFYARSGVSKETQHLVDFISRQSVLNRP